ncbi:MAG: hypothetical protein V9G23_03930, partial [Giesbergeria sp.]
PDSYALIADSDSPLAVASWPCVSPIFALALISSEAKAFGVGTGGSFSGDKASIYKNNFHLGYTRLAEEQHGHLM